MKTYSILVVDDDILVLQGLSFDLKDQGWDVTMAENGETAITLLNDHLFDLVITDLMMKGIGGIEVLRAAKEKNPETMVIILTGFGEMENVIDALRLDADDFLLKPCKSEEMNLRVQKCLEKLEMKRKIKIYEEILPICCICKNIRDDIGKEPGKGEWMTVEQYLWNRARVAPSSSYCPECAEKVKTKLGY